MNILGSDYESRITEEAFFVGAEIFIDLNLAYDERRMQFDKVIRTFNEQLKLAETQVRLELSK